jgi:hypothetical protein
MSGHRGGGESRHGQPRVPGNIVILFFVIQRSVRQMTRADLTEQICQAMKMPRKESDVVVCSAS